MLARQQILPLVKIESVEKMAETFLFVRGKNTELSVYFIIFKIITMVSPLIQFYVLCGNIGHQYKSYGLDMATSVVKEVWPLPQDLLFPKVGKCEYVYYTDGGDENNNQFICEIVNNSTLQWSFLLIWYWLWMNIFLSLFTLIFVLCLFKCFQTGINLSFPDFVLLWYVKSNLNRLEYLCFLNFLEVKEQSIHHNQNEIKKEDVKIEMEDVKNEIEFMRL